MPLHCGTEQRCSAYIELVEMIDGHLRLQLGAWCRCIAEAYQNDRYVSRFGCHHIDVAVADHESVGRIAAGKRDGADEMTGFGFDTGKVSRPEIAEK